uniref:EGF-like domain-containing protein n=1 Tax=Macrostomum lignano TaxID=282301 RepID=A0A1I8FPW5_9PLAT
MRQIISRRLHRLAASSPGSLGCAWLQSGQQSGGFCLPAAFIEPLCPDGACGKFALKSSPPLIGSAACPALNGTGCDNQTYCKSCLARCRGRVAGAPTLRQAAAAGRCLVGGFAKPSAGEAACASPSSWHFDACPPENECENGHHNCDLERQVCVDQIDGVQGRCTKPDVCTCLFGYTGDTCDVACDCNGHSNCAGPSPADRATCLSCHNNTRGSTLPVLLSAARRGRGPPLARRACPAASTRIGLIDFFLLMAATSAGSNRDRLLTMPSAWAAMATLRAAAASSAAGATTGSASTACCPLQALPVQRALDFCLPDTGQGCDCQNNTRTSCTDRDQRCREQQCAVCARISIRASLRTAGSATTRWASTHYFCLDYRHSQKACGVNPGFLNIDVRLFVDIIRGAADLYLALSDRTFVVNNTVDANGFWSNLVSIDYQAAATVAKATRRSKAPSQRRQRPPVLSDRVLEVSANPYLTYVSLPVSGSILIVRNATRRVLITIPCQSYEFSLNKFYLVVQGVSTDVNVSGIVFFRQDQNHINLLVFFSMFFSCFFLLFGLVVLAWKARQAHSRRVARQRRERERQSMAARPFGRVRLILPCATTDSSHAGLVNPVCLEPLVTGAAGKAGQAAALCTVLIQLPHPQPGGSFCLGSALVLTRGLAPFLHGRAARASSANSSFSLIISLISSLSRLTSSPASRGLSSPTMRKLPRAAANAEIVVEDGERATRLSSLRHQAAMSIEGPMVPGGSRLASFSPSGFLPGRGGQFRANVRDSKSLELLQSFACADQITDLAWSPDSLFSDVWSLEHPDWACKIDEGVAGLVAACWAPDSRRRRGLKDCVSVFNCGGDTGWQLVAHFDAGTEDLDGLAWSPDATALACWDGCLRSRVAIFSPT